VGASDLEVMGTGDAAAEAPENEVQRKKIAGRSPTRIAFDRLRKDKVALVCATVALFFAIIAVFCPLIAKAFGVSTEEGDPITQLDTTDPAHYNYPLTGPPFHGFTWSHPLGLAPSTANDNLAYWLYGARTSLSIALAATILTTVIGVVVGLIAGTATGWLDRGISFVIDVFLSFPFLLGALALAPIIISHFQTQPSLLDKAQIVGLIGVLTVLGWMTLARLIRGSVLSLREREFVQAAEVIGVPKRRILFREMLPNMMAPIIVSISLSLPAFVSLEAGLSYLGIGITGTPSWGQTINSAAPYFETYPLYLWAPLIGVLVLVLSLNLLGDSVRDAFDPKTRQ
jgi:ABC-type dipeptide/oligopeptide/nickel transport system permease subunit